MRHSATRYMAMATPPERILVWPFSVHSCDAMRAKYSGSHKLYTNLVRCRPAMSSVLGHEAANTPTVMPVSE